MPDMLVHLRKIPNESELMQKLLAQGIKIQRAIAPDKFRIIEWVKANGGKYGAGECDISMSTTPCKCFIATKNKVLLGYACYDAIAPDFFGPTMVLEEYRGVGIGKALLIRCLEELKSEGYVYAVIGGVGPSEFYTKCVNAVTIENSAPGIYEDFLMG